MYKNWEDLIENADKGFLNTELSFTSMHKGDMYYSGKYDGKRVHCTVSEAFVSDYDYSATEKVSSVTQGCYVYLTVDGEEVLNVK